MDAVLAIRIGNDLHPDLHMIEMQVSLTALKMNYRYQVNGDKIHIIKRMSLLLLFIWLFVKMDKCK